MTEHLSSIPAEVWAEAERHFQARCHFVHWQRVDNAKAQALLAIAEAIIAERDRNGGVSATRFLGLTFVIHPDFPPHFWDGKKMHPLVFADNPERPA